MSTALEPLDRGRTRLLTRSRATYEGAAFRVLLRPIHFGMQRLQLLRLKRLAERRPGAATL